MPRMMKTPSLEFNGFGPSFLHHRLLERESGAGLVVDRIESRKTVRTTAPAVPGVYGWIGEDNRLIYVGKSKSLRHRLLSYFAVNPADPKMERIRRSATRLAWQPVGHELLALLREQELIHRWRPEFNSMGQPNRRLPAFVAISDSAAPHAFLTKRLSTRTQRAFGPIVGTAELGEAVAALNQVFQLRDCPDKTGFRFGEQLALFSDLGERAQCLRYELGSCPAPCGGFCTRPDYQRRVENAIRFLEGRDGETVPRLERAMLQAAGAQQYERAAIFHQQAKALARLLRQLERLRSAEQQIHGTLVLPGGTRRQLMLVFSRGALIHGFPLPRSDHRRRELADWLTAAALRPLVASDDNLAVSLRLIVSRWFRQNRDVLTAIRPFEQAAADLAMDRVRQSA